MTNPVNIYSDTNEKQLLIAKGVPLNSRTKELLSKKNIQYLDFPLPHENGDQTPFSFSEEVESALFQLAYESFHGYQEGSGKDPFEIRKVAYEILAQAFHEFQRTTRSERPLSGTAAKRTKKSVLHLRTVGAISDYLYEHAKNVALTCLAIGLNYFHHNNNLLSHIHKVSVAGLFADIGMMNVPTRIIRNQGTLSEEEWDVIHRHPLDSARFVESMFRRKDMVTAKIVEQHHERSNRSGYPNKMGGAQIDPLTHIVSVADTYHSMISKRYYRESHHPVDAILFVNKNAETLFQPLAVRCLNFRIAPYPIGSVALLDEKTHVQINAITNVPIEFSRTKVLKAELCKKIYNIPKSVHTFTPLTHSNTGRTSARIEDHLHKLTPPLDTFDLLKLYGYVTH